MEHLSITEVKHNFEDVLKLVANGKQRIVIRERGRDRAALIPTEDLSLLETMDRDANVAIEHLDVEDVKKHLSQDLDEVARRKERIVLQQNGAPLAALVPERDLEFLENLDARLDIEAAKRLLQRQMESDELA
jgi:prevent-host-death family protein